MNYDEFWLRYLRAHAKPVTRGMHYMGSLIVVGCLIAALITLDWYWLVAAPLIGYAFAWSAHFFLEGNHPETFGHPFWSFFSDFRMTALFLTGRLVKHLQRAGVL